MWGSAFFGPSDEVDRGAPKSTSFAIFALGTQTAGRASGHSVSKCSNGHVATVARTLQALHPHPLGGSPGKPKGRKGSPGERKHRALSQADQASPPARCVSVTMPDGPARAVDGVVSL